MPLAMPVMARFAALVSRPRMRFAVLAAALSACAAPATSEEPAPDAADPTTMPPPSGAAPVLPTPTGTCPALAPGDVTFAPAGIAPRTVKLAFEPAKPMGELLLYWHATGSGPGEAAYALGATQAQIIARGGVIATPSSDPAAGQFEWFIVNGSPRTDDFMLADEIVGCFAAAHRIDPVHVHSMGMSAGALQTTALSFLRSSYIASVATYSGGLPSGFDPALQNPENKFAALIFDGGASDAVFGVDFKAASEAFKARLAAAGHFVALCDHGRGHAIPLDAAPSVAEFFTANPYGAWPSPFAAGLPASFPAYCME